MIEEEILLKAYSHLLCHPQGYLSDLDLIDTRLADYFANMGFIAYGMNSGAKSPYQITSIGKEITKKDYISIYDKKTRSKIEDDCS